jgi:hypothetical protein
MLARNTDRTTCAGFAACVNLPWRRDGQSDPIVHREWPRSNSATALAMDVGSNVMPRTAYGLVAGAYVSGPGIVGDTTVDDMIVPGVVVITVPGVA